MEGSFTAGLLDGVVTSLTISHGQEMDKFSGSYQAGARVAGKYEFSSGDVYQGDFKSAEELLQGKYVWACGKVYEGTFRNGKPHGEGLMTYPQVRHFLVLHCNLLVSGLDIPRTVPGRKVQRIWKVYLERHELL